MRLILIACLVVSAYATIPDNCEDGPDNGCDIGGQCVNLGGGVSRCTCFQGFDRSTITSKCIDVDECKSSSSWVCQFGYCRNLVGTYRCVCIQYYGYMVSPDGKACVQRFQKGKMMPKPIPMPAKMPMQWGVNKEVPWFQPYLYGMTK